MKIFIDVWDVESPEPRGIVTLKRQYLYACIRLSQEGEFEIGFTGDEDDREWLMERGLLKYGDFKRYRIPGRFQRILADNNFIPYTRLLGQPDIYHTFGIYPFNHRSSQVVGTLVDFIPLRLPQFVPMDWTLDQIRWCQWAANQPKAKWIAISQKTKQDAIELARLRSDQVCVVTPAVEDDMFLVPPDSEINQTLSIYGVDRPYLLCVNTLNFRKNHARLIEAWIEGDFARKGWNLVLAGHGAGHPLIAALNSGSFDGVRWLGYLPRSQLIHLYYGCEAFVYPSLYEGYGIPVAEAMVAGKAILTSKGSSMREIAGDGASYIDPLDAESIVQGLTKITSDSDLREELASNNLRHRMKHSTERLANDLNGAYQNILQ